MPERNCINKTSIPKLRNMNLFLREKEREAVINKK